MDPSYQWPPQGYPNAQYNIPPPQLPPPQQPHPQQQHQQNVVNQNAYAANGYMQYQPPPPMQTMPQFHQYPQSQPTQGQGQPRVVIPPPRMSQYGSQEDMRQQRYSQPQVVIPPRQQGFSSSPMAGMGMGLQNPKIRQVQVPVQRSGSDVAGTGMGMGLQNPKIRQVQVPVQRSSSDVSARDAVRAQQPQQRQQRQERQRPEQGQHAQQRQQQAPMSASQPAQRSQSFQQNAQPRPQPQQRNGNQQSPNQNQYRAPLQPQSTPQQRAPSYQSSPGQHPSSGLPHTPSSQNRHPQVVIKKTTPQLANGHSRLAHTPQKALPTDLSVLLLHAADEYIAAARSMGSVAALGQREADLNQYYKLMATGLGCMEAILKRYTQPPRDEAKLRLRYASLLMEETDNDVEVEEVISKGIALCNRSRFLDLKYSMQHLQARFQFRTNHRAALKSLDGPISEAETFKHIVWVYAFRFLKVSLALQVPGRPEMANAIQQLHAIINHAERLGDRAIFVTASALEAMIHLRTAGPDHLEHAQRSIAAARSYQLQASTKELGQIAVLIDSIDIACCLQKGESVREKMRAFQQRVDGDLGPENGVFSVLIEKTFGGQSLTQNTGGVFTKSADARDELVFSWLPSNDLKMLAYYLSGVTAVAQDVSRGRAYLEEGHKLTKDALNRHSSVPTSIPAFIRQRNWVKTLDWHVKFTLGLVACRSDDPTLARNFLVTLYDSSTESPFKENEIFTHLKLYLAGVIAQQSGSLDEALTFYSSRQLSLTETSPASDFKTNIAILATINRLLILHPSTHPLHNQTTPLLSTLDSITTNHPNKTITTALRVLRALHSLSPSPTGAPPSINRQKTLMQNALAVSQQINNYQFMSIVLCFMSSQFFGQQVSEQAVKSVRAARGVCKTNRGVLWKVVSLGLATSGFQRNGLGRDAEECWGGLQRLWGELNEPLRRKIESEGGVAGEMDDGDVNMMG